MKNTDGTEAWRPTNEPQQQTAAEGSNSALIGLLCADCSSVAEPPYCSNEDDNIICEKCAVEKYKKSIGYQIDKSRILARRIIGVSSCA